MVPPKSNGPQSGRALGIVLLALLGLAVAGTIFLQAEKQPEYSPVGRGAQLAVSAGCFACHGRGEGEKRFNLRQRDDKWAPKNNPTFWDGDITKVDELVEWITNGVTAAEVEKHKKLFIKMPAYKDRLKPDEIDAIAAWILAEGIKFTHGPAAGTKTPALADGKSLTPDQLLAAGDRLSRKSGCYQCHGELGQGGVSNPDSFKGYIPGFFGQDFLKLTANGDRAELLHWIDHGRGQAIESGLTGKLAKKYGDGQATQMPGYRDQLAAPEKELLADFMLLLNKAGPLPAKEIERIATLLDAAASN
jgi:mono/diheme cytochrome c family protein